MSFGSDCATTSTNSNDDVVGKKITGKKVSSEIKRNYIF